MQRDKLLIVDDEVPILDICGKIFAKSPYDVITASSGEEALELLKKNPVDILLTDIKMPGMGGEKLLEEGKKIHPDMSTAVITGHGDMKLAIETMGLGAQSFIVKPFTPSEIRTAVSRLSERNRLLKENMRLKSLVPLIETSRKMNERVEINGICNIVATEVLKGVKGDSVIILLCGEDDYRIAAHAGSSVGIMKWLERNGNILNRAVHDHDARTEGKNKLLVDELKNYIEDKVGCLSFTVPIVNNGMEKGFIFISKVKSMGAFTPGDMEYVTILSNHLSASLERSNLYKEREKTLNDLKEADRIKDAFLRNISHEFRTPLNVIIGFAGVLLEQSKKVKPSFYQEEQLNIIHSKGEELLSLFENLMDASMLEAGTMRVDRKEINILSLISEILSPYEEEGRKKGIDVISNLKKQNIRLKVDERLIRKVLKNILDNAIKFTDKGKVELSFARVGKKALVQVENTGITIGKNKINVIFEKFRQADDSTVRKYGGAGLGLYTAVKMMELMGGGIEVESPIVGSKENNVMQGSKFIVKFPIQ